MDVQMNGQIDGHMEIHPCVLQDINSLGPLPEKELAHIIYSRATPLIYIIGEKSRSRLFRGVLASL